MEEYRIVPWDHLNQTSPGVVLEQYVPPELEDMARQVMMLYDMNVSQMVLVTSKPDKGGAIWKLETDKGPRSIKVLHREPQRSLYSIGAQEYLVQQGAKVPSLILTKDQRSYVETGGKLWIVTDWIEPMQPVSKIDLEGAASLCYGLGEFHRLSKGYVPPKGASNSSRLYGWAKYYEKIMTKFVWFRDIAAAYPEYPSSQHMLSVIGEFEKQANETYARFQQSAYAQMIAKGEPHWGMAHQDYGWSNGQMGPGGIWVIDLDGVSYDLPFRDLRKLITSTMDDMGTWDITWIRGMIEAYHQANPIDQQMFELLCIDMAFPNEFYKHIKEMVFEPVRFLNEEMELVLSRVMATEQSKWQTLAELANDKNKYPLGDYPTNTEQEWTYEAILPDDQQSKDFVADPDKGSIEPVNETTPNDVETAQPVEPVQKNKVTTPETRKTRKLVSRKYKTDKKSPVKQRFSKTGTAKQKSQNLTKKPKATPVRSKTNGSLKNTKTRVLLNKNVYPLKKNDKNKQGSHRTHTSGKRRQKKVKTV